jgi:hypothetical protein
LGGPFKLNPVTHNHDQLDTSLPAYLRQRFILQIWHDQKRPYRGQHSGSDARSAEGQRRYDVRLSHHPQQLQEGTLKVDYNLSPSQTLTLRSYSNAFGAPSTDVAGNMESAYNHQSWTASFWQQMYYFNNLLQHTWTINPKTVNTISVFMTQMSAHSGAQELGSDGKPMCFSNNSGDSNGVNIGVSEPSGSCYMGALRINSNYGFESGWDEPSQELRNYPRPGRYAEQADGQALADRRHRPDASARGREYGVSDSAVDRVWKKWNGWWC